jgi:hypothetical protein
MRAAVVALLKGTHRQRDQADQRIKTQAAGRSLLEVSIAIGGGPEFFK